MSKPIIPHTRRTFLAGTAAAGIAAAVAPYVRAAGQGPRIKSVIRRDETIVRLGGDDDNFHMSWAADDRQFVAVCDGVGWIETPKASTTAASLR